MQGATLTLHVRQQLADARWRGARPRAPPPSAGPERSVRGRFEEQEGQVRGRAGGGARRRRRGVRLLHLERERQRHGLGRHGRARDDHRRLAHVRALPGRQRRRRDLDLEPEHLHGPRHHAGARRPGDRRLRRRWPAAPILPSSFPDHTNGGAGWDVPAGGATTALGLTRDAISMGANADNGCQGATFTVYLKSVS